MTTPKKIDFMHLQFGKRADKHCAQCCNFVEGRYRDRILRKCRVYGLTHSEASDWAMTWTACGMFDQEYSGRPLIELRAQETRKLRHGQPGEEPLEGQEALPI